VNVYDCLVEYWDSCYCGICHIQTFYRLPFEDILIPLLLQHCLILLVLPLTIMVLVVALLLRPL